jgi:peptidase C25-like protein
VPLANRIRLLAVIPAALAVLIQPAVAAPTTTTQNAVNRLVNDTHALTAKDAGRATRRGLIAAATRIENLSSRNPCRAVAAVRTYRTRLPGVNAGGKQPPGAPPGPASLRGTLARDALAVDAGLKQLPGTRRCGGGATKAATTLNARVARSSKTILKMHVKLPVARWEAVSGGGKDFVGVNMDGTDFIGRDGAPGVPAFTRLFAVPRGARLSVKVANARGYTLEGITLKPKQAQAVDGALPPDFPPASTFADKPFKMNRSAYRGGPVPARLAYVTTLGQMRDLRIGAVQIPGAQYDPRKRRARIFTSMDVTVTFKKPGKWLPNRVRTAQEQPFQQVYRQSLENYATVAGKPKARAAADPPTCGEEYLIVTSPALHPAADQFAQAKQNAGFTVAIHDVVPGTSNVDVRTFIRGELTSTTCARPSYVLLLGDTSHVPSFLETCTGIDNCQVTSDLSYSLDGVGTDAFADVLLGRIPANTNDVAQAVVSKIIAYETTLPAPAGDDFYNHATVTSNFDGLGPRDGRGFTLSAERFRAGLRSRGHIVTRLNSALSTADIQQFKDSTPIPDELKRPATAWDSGRDQVVNELNAGRFLFVHRDHGSRLGWANPSININDIALLNSNSTKLPVVFAINCSSAGFQFPGNPSFDERLLQRVGGGAVAVFGDTDTSPTGQNDLLTVGWADAMFPRTVPTFGASQPLTRLGEILVAGKAYMASQAAASQQLTGNTYKEHLLWHLLGDPSMEIRAAVPTSFDAAQLKTKFEHRTDQFPVGDPSFRVRVTSTQPGTDGALVTLLHAGEVIGRATMTSGVALVTPTKRTDSASLSVSLERDGFLQADFPVSAPVPNLTMTCAQSVNVPSEDNGVVRGTVSPKVSGATIRLRATRPSGAVTTHSTTTLSDSTWAIKIPMSTADIGSVKIDAFYDGAGKYGSDDATCTIPVE